MALSLWFYHTVAEQYGRDVIKRVDDYPFCKQLFYSYFYDKCEPSVLVDRKLYALEPAFVAWFYRRGLEIAFLDILQFSFHVYRQAMAFKNSHNYYFRGGVCNREISDRHYLSKLSNGRFHFYYANEHPLDAYSPDKVARIDAICRKFRKYHVEHSLDWYAVGFASMGNGKFKYQDYLMCVNNFTSYASTI